MAARRKNTGICHDCFPDGWPGGTYAAGCAHGTFSRKDPLGTADVEEEPHEEVAENATEEE